MDITMSKEDLTLNKTIYRQLDQLKGVVADHQFNDAAMPAMVVIQLTRTADLIEKMWTIGSDYEEMVPLDEIPIDLHPLLENADDSILIAIDADMNVIAQHSYIEVVNGIEKVREAGRNS